MYLPFPVVREARRRMDVRPSGREVSICRLELQVRLGRPRIGGEAVLRLG